MITAPPEMFTLKSRLRSSWMAGDYAHFATYLQAGALQYLAGLAIAPGTRVLDVGCGTGQIAIPAARGGARVTGIDIAPNLVAEARFRAWIERVDASFDEGDAEALPYDDASFDLVVSLMGAIFAPRPERVIAELFRVCRRGGRIAMANWTPDGHVGQLLKILGRYVPPSPLMASPLEWGVEGIVRDRMRRGFARVEMTKRLYPMHFPLSPAAVVEFFREYYGPANRAYAALDDEAQHALRAEMLDLWELNNRAQDGSTYVEAEYLDVIATRAP